MLFAIFLTVLSVSLMYEVSARTVCSSSDQLIFKISSSTSNTNAHGEVWNGAGNYEEEICYDKIFSPPYSGGNPHVCDGNNEVLVLSGDTNAHAEKSGLGNYNVPICYGDLNCVAQGPACSGDYFEVATISSSTNGHIETRGANSFTSGLKICCTSPSASGGSNGAIDNVEWQNTAGRKITETNVGKTVRMYAATTAQDGETIEFYAWDDDDENGEFDFGDEALFDNPVSTTVSGGVAKFDFDITQELIDRQGLDDYFLDCNNGLEFYFEANILGSQEKISSGLLSVDCNEGQNEPPHSNITSPEHRGIYFNNTNIEFNHSSFDDSGAIVGFLWTVYKDGVFEFESNEESFNHIFTNAGQRTITLKVTDDEGLWDEDQISILVIASPGMLAYINDPLHHQVIVNEGLNFRYNASDSYVIDSIYRGPGQCDYEITCKAGFCPDKTKNAPNGCEPIALTLPLNIGFSDSNFTWRFRDGRLDNSFSELDAATGRTVFGIASDRFNDKKIDLLLKDENLNIQNPTQREFTLLDPRQCIDGGLTWVELDENGFVNQTYSTLDDPSACAGKDRLIGSGDDCCPSGMACSENGCVGSVIDSCSDYTDETACKNDATGMGRPPEPNDPLWEEKNCGGRDEMGRIVQCACGWDSNPDEGFPNCGLNVSYRSGGYGKIDPCTEYQCLYTYDEGECNNGFMELTIKTKYNPGNCNQGIGEAQCNADAGTKIVPCGRPTIELPFFGKEQFIGTLILIILIYLILKNVKLPGRKDNRKK